MTSFVFASSPLVGPTVLAPLAATLRGLGHSVSSPPAPAGLAEFVDGVAACIANGPSVLMSFSAAGPRSFAVAAACSPRAIVFVDARLPVDGVPPDAEPAFAEILDALTVDGDGNLPPWTSWWPGGMVEALCPDPARRAELVAGCPEVPRAMFSAPIPAPPFDGPCGYVLLSDGYRDQADLAVARGWPAAQVGSVNHLAPFLEPGLVADAVLDVAEKIT